MRVCFIAGTLGRGGAEKQLVYMLRALQKAQVETDVLCLTQGESYEREIKALGIKIEWVGKNKNNFLRLGKIIGYLRRRSADVLQSAHFYTNIYTALAGRALGIPSIGAIRNDLLSEIKANQIFGKGHLRLPKHLIANSSLAHERALALGILPSNINFVRNVVSNENLNFAENHQLKETINILFAGRLVEQKRPEIFINLAEKLLQTSIGNKLKFQIAGDGILREKLESLAKELNLDKNKLAFLGIQNDMSQIYKRTDVLVLTSSHEGTPNVVLEAMSYGIPVVATKVGGVPEILPEDCGLLVDADDNGKLFDSVSNLIADKELRFRLGSNALKNVERYHSLDYLQSALLDIYSRLAFE